ncbi:MAG: hypothetical protein P4L48_23520 [Mycobacterium sp.]|nr:hypothetical protein [Mycobacterium sp.]MDR3662014.1 hypothetical protein [Mycobacterium sp.]
MTAYDEGEIIDAEIVESGYLPAKVDASNAERIRPPGWVEKPPPSPRRDAELSAHPENQCVGHKKNGERCRKYAIRGSTVCRTHGGATKHVRDRARVRVQNASDRLVSKLIEFAFDDTKPPDTQLRAIRDALDRAGMQPTTTVEIGIAKPYETVFDSIGGIPPRESSSVASEYDSAGLDSAPPAMVDLGYAPAESDSAKWSEDSESFGDGSPRQPQPRERDRERVPQPRERHITGEAALRLANQANLASGAMKAIESPHKGYRRP